MDKALLDLYTDYLISSFQLTTATGMAHLLDGAMSHDKITRFLSKRDFTCGRPVTDCQAVGVLS